MLGWFADFFRLLWGLPYWNLRKTWFRLRRGRSRCPCQTPSDSGKAMKTGCDACASWHRPMRFRRVCPLLVQTAAGPRCSVNTEDVRPFWGDFLLRYTGGLLTVYAVCVGSVFAYYRRIGYPISIVHVSWPGLWYRIPQARGWFFMEKANQAFNAGRTREGLLYLSNAYEFDPTNYAVGLLLAKNYQAGQPTVSDEFFARLMREHPDMRATTAQEWFRALLARGDYRPASDLAGIEALADPAHGPAWIRGLFFSTLQTGDLIPLRDLLGEESMAVHDYHPLLNVELLMRTGRKREARLALDQPWPDGNGIPAAARAFILYYRVSTLTALGDTFAALDLLATHRAEIDDEAAITLRLEAHAAAGTKQVLKRDVDAVLSAKLDPPRVKILCAYLIRHPDPDTFVRVYNRVLFDKLPLDTDSAGAWFSLLCAAGAVHDLDRMHALVVKLKEASNSPFASLMLVEAFFNGNDQAERRITTFLPILPLPLEVTYALLERYPAPKPEVPGPRIVLHSTPAATTPSEPARSWVPQRLPAPATEPLPAPPPAGKK